MTYYHCQLCGYVKPRGEGLFYKEKEMRIPEDSSIVSGGSVERRISLDAQGDQIGSWVFGGINNHSTFKGDDGIQKHIGQTIAEHVKGQFPIGGQCLPGIGQLSVAQGVNNFVPLTANQRLNELRKKITEYKQLLNVVNDATAKSFVTLLLGNIEKELGEIQVELNRNTQVTPVIAPYNPGQPFGPIKTYPTQPFGDYPSLDMHGQSYQSVTGKNDSLLQNQSTQYQD